MTRMNASHRRRTRINPSESGRLKEQYAIEALEALGYKVHRCIRNAVEHRDQPGTYIHLPTDFFGCIDLIAKRRGERTRWVQVTSADSVARKVRDLSEVPWDEQFDSVEIWQWMRGDGPRLDKRTGEPRQRLLFKLYRMDNAYTHLEGDVARAPRHLGK